MPILPRETREQDELELDFARRSALESEIETAIRDAQMIRMDIGS